MIFTPGGDHAQHRQGGRAGGDVQLVRARIGVGEKLFQMLERADADAAALAGGDVHAVRAGVIEHRVDGRGAPFQFLGGQFAGPARAARVDALGDLPEFAVRRGAPDAPQIILFAGKSLAVFQILDVLGRVDRLKCDAFAGRREHFFVEGRPLQSRFGGLLPLLVRGDFELVKGDRSDRRRLLLVFFHGESNPP